MDTQKEHIEYIDVNNEIFYSLIDILYVFKLNIITVSNIIANNYLSIKMPNSPNVIQYINSDTIDSFSYLNHSIFIFSGAVKRVINEDSYDREKMWLYV